MDVRARGFTSMCLTFLVTLVCLNEFSSASITLDKPTNLRITSVHDLTITLTWQRPSGIPIATNLLYIVRFMGNGQNRRLPLQPEESAQITLLRNTQYNINVRAIRSDDHQVQSDWASLRVDTRDFVPAKPKNVRMTRVIKFIARVAWDRPQTTPTGIPDTSGLSYQFSYQKLGSLAKQLKTTTNAFSLRLTPNSKYAFKVRAYKSFDFYGPWSDTLNYTSKEGVPSKPPANVIAVSNTSSSIAVSWGPIPEDGRSGAIQGFVVFYCEQTPGHCSQRDVKLIYSTQITGLVTGKQYKVRVAGYTKAGTGKRSPATTVVAGGPFITTTTQTPAQKPTTLKLTSTTKKTSTKSSTLSPTMALTQRLQRTSIGTPETVPAPFEPTTSVSTNELHDRTGKLISEESTKGGRTVTESPVFQSTPPVAFASRADEESPPGITDKLLTIGAPAVGVLILLIILGAVVVFSRKRSRKRRRQNGEIPLEPVNLQRHERSRDAVTRGASSVRYAPPGDDSMTQGLLQSLEHNNDSLPKGMAENAPLLGATCPEKCKLSVDLNTAKGELEQGRAEGLYESIGSLKGAGCENMEKNDNGDRYVTHNQMGVKHDKAPWAPASQTSPQCNGAVARENPQGKIYENLQRSEHLYDTLTSDDQDGPVYENTRVSPSPSANKTDKDGDYEPLPI